MTATLSALTLSQPWATLIARGHKQVETRKWHPKENPGLLAIASSNKNPTAGQRAMIEQEPFLSALDGCGLPRRSILAVVQIIGFERTEEIEISDTERAFGDYRPGRWAWRFGEIITLATPVELHPVIPKGGGKPRLPGTLGIWPLPKPFNGQVQRAAGSVEELRRLEAKVIA